MSGICMLRIFEKLSSQTVWPRLLTSLHDNERPLVNVCLIILSNARRDLPHFFLAISCAFFSILSYVVSFMAKPWLAASDNPLRDNPWKRKENDNLNNCCLHFLANLAQDMSMNPWKALDSRKRMVSSACCVMGPFDPTPRSLVISAFHSCIVAHRPINSMNISKARPPIRTVNRFTKIRQIAQSKTVCHTFVWGRCSQ